MEIVKNTAPNGTQIEAILSDGDLWFSQSTMSHLFGTTVPNINMHLGEISRRVDMNELRKGLQIDKMEGRRKIRREIIHVSHEIVHMVALKGQYWDELNWLIEMAKETGVLRQSYRVLPVKEREFGDMLIGILTGTHRVETQFPVAPFFIDFFLPDIPLAVEYDESHHFTSNNQEKDAERERAIRKAIPGVMFVRVREGEEATAFNRILKIILQKQEANMTMRMPDGEGIAGV